MRSTRWLGAALVVVCLHGLAEQAEAQQPLQGLRRILGEAHDTLKSDAPHVHQDDAIETLASNIDWLERYIDDWGSVVAKSPDIWGEARLTRHRDEYEQQLRGLVTKFELQTNATVSSRDLADLQQLLALEILTAPGGSESASVSASSNRQNETEAATNNITINADGALANSLNRSNVTNPIPPADDDDAAATPPAPPSFPGLPSSSPATSSQVPVSTARISLEPTIALDQQARYLNHLHELRRLGEGDDTADSPGYSMNLVRIPISILPGHQSRKGFGAEATITATPYVSNATLGDTFRNLVINDLVELLSLPTLRIAENYTLVSDSSKDSQRLEERSELGQSQSTSETTEPDTVLTELEAQKDAFNVLYLEGYDSNTTPKAADIIIDERNFQSSIALSSLRNGRYPIPGSQIVPCFGTAIFDAGNCAFDQLQGRDARWQGGGVDEDNRMHMLDVRSFLYRELQGAYDLATSPDVLPIVISMIEGGLAEKVINDNPREIVLLKNEFHGLVRELRIGLAPNPTKLHQNTLSLELAWAVVVEAALLDRQLEEDLYRTAEAKGASQLTTSPALYYLPTHCLDPSDEYYADYLQAAGQFAEYVKVRWPVHVFALDPVTQDQNVDEEFRRRRELQLAMTVGFLNGQVSGNSLTRFARTLEQDMRTVAINRTVVGFSHGEDTFGWRFTPRIQSPPPVGQLRAFGQTLIGGPSRDADLAQRELEPGTRECVALVLMPSFVPYCDFDVRTDWYSLTNPRQTELSMRDTMRLSRSVTAMRNSAAICSQCQHLYRPGEVDRLLRRVDQLDRELPLQSMRVQVPYENTVGGFQMFNTGVTDLAPQLVGWHGGPGIQVSQVTPSKIEVDKGIERRSNFTALYLIGKNFSVHGTEVIAGGRLVNLVHLESREIMHVEIPRDVMTVQIDGQDYVPIHISTPYGVTSHLHVPAIDLDKKKDDAAAAAAEATLTQVLSEIAPTYRLVEGEKEAKFESWMSIQRTTIHVLAERYKTMNVEALLTDQMPVFHREAGRPKTVALYGAIGSPELKSLIGSPVLVGHLDVTDPRRIQIPKEAFEILLPQFALKISEIPLEKDDVLDLEVFLYYSTDEDEIPRRILGQIPLKVNRFLCETECNPENCVPPVLPNEIHESSSAHESILPSSNPENQELPTPAESDGASPAPVEPQGDDTAPGTSSRRLFPYPSR
jgi:hypothetical protein